MTRAANVWEPQLAEGGSHRQQTCSYYILQLPSNFHIYKSPVDDNSISQSIKTAYIAQKTGEFSHYALRLNNVVLRCCGNAGKDRPGCHSLSGRSFHCLGPAVEKLLLQNLLCVRETINIRMSFAVALSVRRPARENTRQSSARYSGD